MLSRLRFIALGLLLACGLGGYSLAAGNTAAQPVPADPLLTPTPTATPPCGPAWRSVVSPILSDSSGVNGMLALAPNDVWAVGSWVPDGSSDSNTLTEHWDGVAWTVVPSPNVPNGANLLKAVAGLSTNDIWAVGNHYSNGTPTALIAHWDGQTWSLSTPFSAGTSLAAVSVLAANDIWAVGGYNYDTFHIHWDGSTWQQVPGPYYSGSSSLFDVSGSAPNDVWTVGTQYGGSVLEHWDGATWTTMSLPALSETPDLHAVRALAANDVWIAGDSYTTGQFSHSLVLHWDGTNWSQVPSPSPQQQNLLYAVSAVAPNDIWAAGFTIAANYNTYNTLTEHWDGTAWSLVPSPGDPNSLFYTVAAHGSGDAWAGGSSQVNSGPVLPLIAHYSDPCVTPSPTTTGTPPMATATRTPLPTTTATGSPPPSATATRTATASPTATTPSCGPGSNYTASVSAGAAITPGTTLIAGTQCDSNCPPVGIGLPFPVLFYDQQVTTAVLGTDGVISFGFHNNPVPSSCLPSSDFAGAIAGYWDDLDMSAAISPTLGVYLSTSGTAPDRVLHLEYRACRYANGQCGGYVNFEVRLYESRPQFEVVYGAVVDGGQMATVGAQEGAGGRWVSYECQAGGLAAGLEVTFAQPVCGAATSTATAPPAGTPSATPAPPSATATGRPASPTPTATPTACAITFSDVHQTDYFYQPVQYLACRGVLSGYGDGSFRPYNQTTRSQMVKIVVLGFARTITTPPAGNYTFTDVPPTNPFFSVVETAAAGGIVSGYTCGGPGEPCDEQHRPYFHPYANVTRGQLSKIDVVAAGWPLQNPASPTFDDVAPGSAFYPFVETAVCHNVISGYADHTFRPGASATRGQIAKIVSLSITDSGTCSEAAAR